MSSHVFGVMSDGTLVEETDLCSCAYPDCGGYSSHEPNCGLKLIGYLPKHAAVDPDPSHNDEPDLLPSMLWDFSSVDHFMGMRVP